MPRINSRAKGANGEREFAKWLKENLNLQTLPQRNLEQVREGGSDILGVGQFVFEVKRVENLDLLTWWNQVVNDARLLNKEPVVAFRQNNKKWEFLISARNIDQEFGCLRLPESVFIKYASFRLNGLKGYINYG